MEQAALQMDNASQAIIVPVVPALQRLPLPVVLMLIVLLIPLKNASPAPASITAGMEDVMKVKRALQTAAVMVIL